MKYIVKQWDELKPGDIINNNHHKFEDDNLEIEHIGNRYMKVKVNQLFDDNGVRYRYKYNNPNDQENIYHVLVTN